MPAATQQSPAAKPAPTPSAGAGLGPRKRAKTADWTRASRNAAPNIRPLLPPATCSSLSPAAACQGLANRAEYQSPPSTKLNAAAARTASQFTCGMSIVPLLLKPSGVLLCALRQQRHVPAKLGDGAIEIGDL